LNNSRVCMQCPMIVAVYLDPIITFIIQPQPLQIKCLL
jgi:hypothetical protein